MSSSSAFVVLSLTTAFSRYVYFEGPLTYDQAKQSCYNSGTEIATIVDDDDRAAAQAAINGRETPFIGLQDVSTVRIGFFEYTDEYANVCPDDYSGACVDFWVNGEPTCSKEGGFYCTAFDATALNGDGGITNDIDCDIARAYLCNAVPGLDLDADEDNDLSCNALPVPINTIATGTTSFATVDLDLPRCDSATANGIWYSVTNVRNLVVETLPIDGNCPFDTRVSLFLPCGDCSAPVEFGCLHQGTDVGAQCSIASTPSGVAFSEVLILLHGFASATGTVPVQITGEDVDCDDASEDCRGGSEEKCFLDFRTLRYRFNPAQSSQFELNFIQRDRFNLEFTTGIEINFQNAPCVNPRATFQYERIDYDNFNETVMVRNDAGTLNQVCGGGDVSNSCGDFETCFTDMVVGPAQFNEGETVVFDFILDASVEALCDTDRALNSNFILTCDPVV